MIKEVPHIDSNCEVFNIPEEDPSNYEVPKMKPQQARQFNYLEDSNFIEPIMPY
jgi:hypothetical protein